MFFLCLFPLILNIVISNWWQNPKRVLVLNHSYITNIKKNISSNKQKYLKEKKLFLLLYFTSINFIFIATISIYQLINAINKGVFGTWNIQGNA